jgi:hypothetical protein
MYFFTLISYELVSCLLLEFNVFCSEQDHEPDDDKDRIIANLRTTVADQAKLIAYYQKRLKEKPRRRKWYVLLFAFDFLFCLSIIILFHSLLCAY